MPKESRPPFQAASSIDHHYYWLVERVKHSRSLYFEHSKELKGMCALGWEVKEAKKREQMGYAQFWLNSWVKWFDRLQEYIKEKGY